MIEILGGRKFLIALLATLGNIGLVWFGKIEAGVYSTVSIAIIGAYIAGNVIQKKDTPAPVTK